MSIQASIPVETINEKKSLEAHEDSDSDDDSVGPPPMVPRTCDLEAESSDDEDSDDDDDVDMDDDESAGPPPEFAKTYRTKIGQDLKAKQELWIQKKLKKEGFTLVMFHKCFPVREKYAYWHEDTKEDEDIIRKEDVQIIRDWTTDVGPRVVDRTDYGLGLEDVADWNNAAGVPWWMFKTSSRDKFINEVGIVIETGNENENIEVQNEADFQRDITSNEQPELRVWDIPASSTDKQEEIFAWILRQNIIAERQAYNAGIVANLQQEAEALREQAVWIMLERQTTALTNCFQGIFGLLIQEPCVT